MTFDEILSSIADDGDKETARSLFQRNPVLNQAVLRQSDYSRKMDELKAKEGQFAAIAEYAQNWETWKENNWDPNENATKAEVALRQQIAELQASKGDDMTFDQINQFITEKGLVDRNTFQSTIDQKAQEIGRELQGTAYVTAKMVDIASKHLQEFGEPFSATDFLRKFPEFGATDIDRAYEISVQEKRASREQAKLTDKLKEVEKAAFDKGREDAIKNVLGANRSNGIPTDDAGQDMGYIQRRALGLAEDTAVNGKLDGSGKLGYQVAQKYAQDKLSTSNA